jgi:transposase
MAKSFTQEFKDRTCDLIFVEKESIRQVSKRLGISYHTLHDWVAKRRAGAGAVAPTDVSDSDDPAVLKARIKALEARARRAEMSVDILKKATAYFANQSL